MFKRLGDFFVPSMRCEYCAEDADSESCHRYKVIQLSQGHMITHGQLPPIFWHSIVFSISIHFHSLQKSTHHSRSMEPTGDVSLQMPYGSVFCVNAFSAHKKLSRCYTWNHLLQQLLPLLYTTLCPHEISSHHNRAWETVGYSFTRDWVLQDRTAICLRLNSYILGLSSA